MPISIPTDRAPVRASRSGPAVPLFALLVLMLGVVATFVITRPEDRRHSAQVALVWDVSPSMRPNCNTLEATVRATIAGPELRIRRDSKFFLIETGDKNRALDPRLVVELPIPRRVDAVLGGEAADSARMFYAALRRACNTLSTTDASPIHRSIDVALAALAGRGCTDAAACVVIVRSDLIENVNPAVVQRLSGTPAQGDSSQWLLTNSGARVRLCGWVRESDVGGETPDQLLDRWRGLFSHPEVVEFLPFCPGTASPVATAS
jgi:hypothetical protein